MRFVTLMVLLLSPSLCHCCLGSCASPMSSVPVALMVVIVFCRQCIYRSVLVCVHVRARGYVFVSFSVFRFRSCSSWCGIVVRNWGPLCRRPVAFHVSHKLRCGDSVRACVRYVMVLLVVNQSVKDAIVE